VVAVDGGPAALEALKEHDFALMMTDVAMPG
jgi:CheY-like chemotaxis protein